MYFFKYFQGAYSLRLVVQTYKYRRTIGGRVLVPVLQLVLLCFVNTASATTGTF